MDYNINMTHHVQIERKRERSSENEVQFTLLFSKFLIIHYFVKWIENNKNTFSMFNLKCRSLFSNALCAHFYPTWNT